MRIKTSINIAVIKKKNINPKTPVPINFNNKSTLVIKLTVLVKNNWV